MSETPAPLGLRQNNPGNIDVNPEYRWLGEIASPNRFCMFNSMQYGMRALLTLLGNYYFKDGCQTIRDFINRWAPPTENDVGAYLADVVSYMNNQHKGFSTECYIDATDRDDRIALAMAIAHHENGGNSALPSLYDWQCAWDLVPNKEGPTIV